MTIDKNMNFTLIHIPGGKLQTVSIIGQQEKKATNDSNELNPSIYSPRCTFLDSAKK
jgi:hypothetical protein